MIDFLRPSINRRLLPHMHASYIFEVTNPMQISYQDWSDFLLRVGAVCSPAELHGLLCGMHCREPKNDWMADARAFMDLLDGCDLNAVNAALEAQYEAIGAALNDGQYHMQLLLPDDVLPVASRAEGLALWCQGFLHGFAGSEDLLERLDEETREAVKDLAEIAQLDDQCDDSEENEQNLLSLVEYARVTFFSIVSQLRPLSAEVPYSSATRH